MSRYALAFGFKELIRPVRRVRKRGFITTNEESINLDAWYGLIERAKREIEDVIHEHRPINEEDAGTTDNTFTIDEIFKRIDHIDTCRFVRPLLAGAVRMGVIVVDGKDSWRVVEYDPYKIYGNRDMIRECDALAA